MASTGQPPDTDHQTTYLTVGAALRIRAFWLLCFFGLLSPAFVLAFEYFLVLAPNGSLFFTSEVIKNIVFLLSSLFVLLIGWLRPHTIPVMVPWILLLAMSFSLAQIWVNGLWPIVAQGLFLLIVSAMIGGLKRAPLFALAAITLMFSTLIASGHWNDYPRQTARVVITQFIFVWPLVILVRGPLGDPSVRLRALRAGLLAATPTGIVLFLLDEFALLPALTSAVVSAGLWVWTRNKRVLTPAAAAVFPAISFVTYPLNLELSEGLAVLTLPSFILFCYLALNRLWGTLSALLLLIISVVWLNLDNPVAFRAMMGLVFTTAGFVAVIAPHRDARQHQSKATHKSTAYNLLSAFGFTALVMAAAQSSFLASLPVEWSRPEWVRYVAIVTLLGLVVSWLAFQWLQHSSATLAGVQFRQMKQRRLVANLIHEMHAPVASIRMFLAGMPRHDDYVREEALRPMVQIVGHLSGLAHDMRLLTRPPESVELRDSEFSLDALFDQFQIKFASIAEKNRVFLHCLPPAESTGVYRCDAHRLTSIVANLVRNACAHSSGNNVWISASVMPGESDQDTLVFSVEDDGTGLAVDVEPSVAGLFKGAEELGPKLGLGLQQVFQWTGLLGGNVSYRRSERGGACFELRCTVPRVASLDQHASDPALAPSAETLIDSVKIERVLVVEDDRILIRALKSLIKRILGCEVITAMNGKQAFERLDETSVDIIFTDYFMPELDGAELIRGLRAQGYDKPIIAVTAASVGSEADELSDAGADFVMFKPMSEADLTELINELLRSRRLERVS